MGLTNVNDRIYSDETRLMEGLEAGRVWLVVGAD
jgi:hypothetical protein